MNSKKQKIIKNRRPNSSLPAPAIIYNLPVNIILIGMFVWSAWLISSWDKAGLIPQPKNFSYLLQCFGSATGSGAIFIFCNLVLGVAVFLSALFLGEALLDFAGLPEAARHRGWSLGLGLGVVSHALLFLGLLGLWRTPIIAAVPAIGLVLGFWRHKTNWRQVFWRPAAENPTPPLSVIDGIFLTLFLFIAAINLVSSLGPEIFYDSLVYHLAMPQLYILYHRIIPTPHMVYTGNPFGAEMLYGLGLMLQGASLAKLFNWGAALLIAGLIYKKTRARFSRSSALFAALLFYSIPLVCFQNWASTVEIFWTLYTLLAVLVLLEACNAASGSGQRYKLLALSGCFVGLAMSVKYPAILGLAALSLPLIFSGQRRENAADYKILTLELLALWGTAALIVIPWIFKNWAFYHNPFYPVFPQFFPHAPKARVAGVVNGDHVRWNSLSAVFSFKTWGDFGDIWSLNNKIYNFTGPATLILLPLAFIPKWKDDTRRIFLIMLGFFITWFLYSRMARFLMPVWPLFCILAALAIMEGGSVAVKFAGLIAGLYGMLLCVSVVCATALQMGLWQVSLGLVSKAAWLNQNHPGYRTPYYAGAQFINEHLPLDAKVLVVGDERGFYYKRKFVTASVFNENPLLEAVENSTRQKDVYSQLKDEGISYLLVNKACSNYESLMKSLPASAIADVARHTTMVYEYKSPDRQAWVQVFKLHP